MYARTKKPAPSRDGAGEVCVLWTRAALGGGLDVHGALAAAARVLLLLVADDLTLGQIVERRAADDAGGVEENFLAVLGADEAEAAVTDETNDGTLHVCLCLSAVL